MLLEPGAVGLDRCEREEVADAVQAGLQSFVVAGVNRPRERLQQLALDVCASSQDHVVLAVVEDVEGVLASVDPTPETARDTGDHVLFAPAQEPELVLAIEQV